jgi:hypothetical protein
MDTKKEYKMFSWKQALIIMLFFLPPLWWVLVYVLAYGIYVFPLGIYLFLNYKMIKQHKSKWSDCTSMIIVQLLWTIVIVLFKYSPALMVQKIL